MIRRKGILKILFVAFAVLLLAVFFAGCGEYTPPSDTGNNTPVTPTPGGDDNPDDPDDPQAEVFTATLTQYDGSPFTVNDYPLITRLQAQWTEITDGSAAVYRANFDKNGVASAGELDGDFNVTLVLTDEFKRFYTYDPNPAREERRDELKATNRKKGVSIPLYRLQRMGASDHMTIGDTDTPYTTLLRTGAYSYTLQSREDSRMFFYIPDEKGKEYSFMTLMDVTEDKVNPIVDLHMGIPGRYVNATPELTQDGGGAEGNYTKNVWLKYQIAKSEGGGLIFNLRSESESPDAYPLTIYFIIEKDGEFTRPVEESVSVPVTEDFTNTPSAPEGTFTFIGERNPLTNEVNRQHILDRSKVKYNSPASGGDGYYYYLNPETEDFFRDGDGRVSAQYRVYAAITTANPVLASAGEPETATLNNGMLARGYYWMVGEDDSPKNYYDFIMGPKGYAANCNADGVYPVTAELKQFLQDFAISQRYFNDGNGFAEGNVANGDPGYNSDEDSQWLFACGVYINR